MLKAYLMAQDLSRVDNADFDIFTRHLEPPPQGLCNVMTGIDWELADSFFSNPDNEDFYWETMEDLEEIIFHGDLAHDGSDVAVLINCVAGIHRCVAMAERLAGAVESWRGFFVDCNHMQLEQAIRVREERDYI